MEEQALPTDGFAMLKMANTTAFFPAPTRFYSMHSIATAARRASRKSPSSTSIDVHAGGQAVVGMVESPRGGDQPKSEDQPRAKQIAHAPQPAVWSADKERQPLPVSGDAERPLPDARRDVPGRPEG